MIITCTNCSARYQLADAKIKATGTKVRCPKCSEKFVVFPEGHEDSVLGERTELVGARPTRSPSVEGTEVTRKSAAQTQVPDSEPLKHHSTRVQPKTNATAKPQAPAVEDADDDDSFNQPTRAYNPGESPFKSPVAPEDEETPVFDRPSGVLPPIQDPAAPPPAEYSEQDAPSEESSSNVRPFGAETLLEIQSIDKKKRKVPKWVSAGFMAAALLAGAFYLFPHIQNLIPSKDSEISVRVDRPSGWYRDDPGVYQEEMVRQAGLPTVEKEKPANVALLAEALVLNGILSNAQDQINQGLLFAQKLQLEHASSAAPLYALSANAIYADQLPVMKTIYSRWPESQKADPEYRLLEFLTIAKSGSIEDALKRAEALLSEMPDFQRANDLALLLVLQNGPIASQVLSKGFRDQLIARYETQRNLKERSMSLLPALYVEIDRLMGRKPKAPEPQPIVKAEEPPKETLPKPTPRNTEPAATTKKTTPRPKPKEPAKTEKPANKRRLPPPSESLVETTKLDTQEKREARKFFSQGNDLYKRGDVEGALAAYRQALKLDAEYADVYKQLGVLYMEQKRNDRAIRSFKIYLQLRPTATDKKQVETWIAQLQ